MFMQAVRTTKGKTEYDQHSPQNPNKFKYLIPD